MIATASHPAAARVVLSADSHTRFLDHGQVKSSLMLPGKQHANCLSSYLPLGSWYCSPQVLNFTMHRLCRSYAGMQEGCCLEVVGYAFKLKIAYQDPLQCEPSEALWCKVCALQQFTHFEMQAKRLLTIRMRRYLLTMRLGGLYIRYCLRVYVVRPTQLTHTRLPAVRTSGA